MGPRYLTECLAASVERRVMAEAYRAYHADCLRLICMALGARRLPRFQDLVYPAPKDLRTGLEIAEAWLRGHGLKDKREVE